MGKLKITEEQYKKLKNNLIERAILSEQTSSQVREVQSKLNSCFNAGLQVDGISGPATKEAIQKYLGL
jgi:peptidoglycan hydrolase-like protein with peptidoglycan-binding domain